MRPRNGVDLPGVFEPMARDGDSGVLASAKILRVVGDSVNPLSETRAAWRTVAARAGVRVSEIEVACSDADKHTRRIERRATDVSRLPLPTWNDVTERDYQPWDRERLVIETAWHVAENVTALHKAIADRVGERDH